MPDLSHKGSAEYWSQYPDSTIYRVVTFMEHVEDWTLDGDPELEAAITTLGTMLDNIQNIVLSQVNHENTFLRLLANIKTSRGLRLLQSIDQAHPGSASKVLMYAEQNNNFSNQSANVFLKRNIVFERLRLMSRIFSEYRLRLVSRALEGEE